MKEKSEQRENLTAPLRLCAKINTENFNTLVLIAGVNSAIKVR